MSRGSCGWPRRAATRRIACCAKRLAPSPRPSRASPACTSSRSTRWQRPRNGARDSYAAWRLDERGELAVEAAVAHHDHLERQTDGRCRTLRSGAQLWCRRLRQPHHTPVVAEVVIAQLGESVKAELGHDAAVKRPREKVGEHIRARL